jgi:hypothetical protein
LTKNRSPLVISFGSHRAMMVGGGTPVNSDPPVAPGGFGYAKNPAKRFLLQTTILVLIHVTQPQRISSAVAKVNLLGSGCASHAWLAISCSRPSGIYTSRPRWPCEARSCCASLSSQWLSKPPMSRAVHRCRRISCRCRRCHASYTPGPPCDNRTQPESVR